MKYFVFLFASSALFLFSSCEDNSKENKIESNRELRDTAKTIFITQQTELRAAEYFTAEIKIPTAKCKMCEKNITKSLNNLDGVVEVITNAHKKIVKVKFNGGKTTLEIIRQAISKAGYDADNVKADVSAYKKLDDCCKM